MLLPHMVCNALVAGGQRSGAGQQAMRLAGGKLLSLMGDVYHIYNVLLSGMCPMWFG